MLEDAGGFFTPVPVPVSRGILLLLPLLPFPGDAADRFERCWGLEFTVSLESSLSYARSPPLR
jgi:hypothetical protein